MLTLFTVCAVLGTAILLMQFGLSLMGIDFHGDDPGHLDFDGHDHHGDGHHDGTFFFNVLSFRSIIAFMAFFGLTGRAVLAAQAAPVFAFLAAMAAGVTAMASIAYVMRLLHNLKHDATVNLDECVGKQAKVHLSIPGQGEGRGKVVIQVADRLIELPAMTSNDGIPSGTHVVVVGIGKDETLEVIPESNLNALALE